MKKNTLRALLPFLCLALAAALLAGCGNDSFSMPDPVSVGDHYSYNFPAAEESKEDIARKALELLHAKDFKALAKLYASSVQATAESLEYDPGRTLAHLGEFRGFTTLPATQAEGVSADYGAITSVFVECAYAEQYVLWNVLLNEENDVLAITTASIYQPGASQAAPEVSPSQPEEDPPVSEVQQEEDPPVSAGE